MKPTVEAEMHKLSFRMGKWLLSTITGMLIVGNSLYLAAFYFAGTSDRSATSGARQPAAATKGTAEPWQQLMPECVGQVPPGLWFSDPVGGLSIALQKPGRIPASRLRWTGFHVWVLNRGDREIAFSKHGSLLQLAVYDRQGHLMTDLDHYGAEFCMMGPGLWDLVILSPGQMIRIETIPKSLVLDKVHRGNYQVEAILRAPHAAWGFSIRRPWNLRKEFHWEGITVWGAGKVVSPRLQIELQ